MGKTVESYRIALDTEIRTWNGFAKALRSDDREAFERMTDACRNHASAGSNATRPEVFESMVMCILLEQQKTLMRLEKELVAVKQKPAQP
ncbi:MAG: hypothetical protein ABSF24_01925 [Candidatus Bathyarchaeia archaeon]|jgi:hypothetical protein